MNGYRQIQSVNQGGVSYNPAPMCRSLRVFAAFFLLAGILFAQSFISLEYKIKAAMLYNFAMFVDWASAEISEHNSIVVGVLGDDPFGAALDEAMRDKTVYGRPILVRRLKEHSDARLCDILFISNSEKEQLPVVFQSLAESKVLTVSDIDEFAGVGGIIGFIIQEGKVRFEINIDAARRAGIRISSRLLNLATVRKDGSDGNGS